jgi:hypothetical protein
MTATLLRFYGFARALDLRQLPRSRAPLACRWQPGPLTRVLMARWGRPEAGRPSQSYHRLRQAARGGAARSRAAARLAA